MLEPDLNSANYCLVIPHFNHASQLIQFLPSLLDISLPILIVDDGSNQKNLSQLEEFVVNYESVQLIKHQHNRGKGAAFVTGACCARALAYTHVIQIDADGQHNTSDINKFIKISLRQPKAIICGKPQFDDSAPLVRVYGRKITTFFVGLESFSTQIKDALCGFRCYPLSSLENIIDAYFVGPRMDFDTEILVKACWLNIPLTFIDTKVIYPEHNTSHFDYLRDNLVLIKLHIRLLLGMAIRSPKLILQKCMAS